MDQNARSLAAARPRPASGQVDQRLPQRRQRASFPSGGGVLSPDDCPHTRHELALAGVEKSPSRSLTSSTLRRVALGTPSFSLTPATVRRVATFVATPGPGVAATQAITAQ